MGFPRLTADFAAPKHTIAMLCRSCRDHIRASSRHRSLPEPWLPRISAPQCPILDIHRDLVLVTPPWRLPSSLASVQKCHGGTNGKCAPTHWHWQKESPDHFVPMSWSDAGALSSSTFVTWTCSHRVLRTTTPLRSSNYHNTTRYD